MESVSQRDFSQIMTESISWPFERKENFFSALIPLITIIATKKMSEISIIPSLLIAAGSFAWFRLYLNNQSINEVKEKKIQAENLSQKIQLLSSYQPLDLTEMQKTFRGYELDDKGVKINQEDYSKKRRSFIEVCEALKLNSEAVENVWKSFSGKSFEDAESRHLMLFSLISVEIKEKISDKSE